MNKKYYTLRKNILFYALTLGSVAVGQADESVNLGAEDSIANANLTKSNQTTNYEVQDIQLAGQLSLLSDETRSALEQWFVEHKNDLNLYSEDDLKSFVSEAQAWLDTKLSGNRFVVSIPAQVLNDGRLYVLIEPRLVDVDIASADGFDENNIRASFPSLLVGKALPPDVEWMDKRELQMANENPLKVTTLDYLIEPDAGVKAKLNAKAHGASKFTIGAANFGNDATGRNMMMLSAVNGNLTGRDDVLSLSGMLSLHPFLDTNLVTLRYTLPNYEAKRTDSIGLTHAYGSFNSPFLSFGNISASGNYDELNYFQSHYLGDWRPVGLKSVKFTLDMSIVANKSNTKFSTVTLSDYDISVIPLTASLEGAWEPNMQSKILGRVQLSGGKAGFLGTSSGERWQASRNGVDDDYWLVRYGLDGKTFLDSGFALSGQLTGQYSQSRLLPIFQVNTLNNYSGVRGYINATASGDSATVLKLQAESPNLVEDVDANIKAYAFYDVGHKSGGSDERTLTSSSTGLGVRVESPEKSFKLDMYAAYKLKGAERDIQMEDASQKNKTSFWFTASYSF